MATAPACRFTPVSVYSWNDTSGTYTENVNQDKASKNTANSKGLDYIELIFNIDGIDISALDVGNLVFWVSGEVETGANPKPRVAKYSLSYSVAPGSASAANTRYNNATAWTAVEYEVTSTPVKVTLDLATNLEAVSGTPVHLTLYLEDNNVSSNNGSVCNEFGLYLLETGATVLGSQNVASPLVFRIGKCPVITDTGGRGIYMYNATPESVISANPGSVCMTPNNFYHKDSGTGNTGWAAL